MSDRTTTTTDPVPPDDATARSAVTASEAPLRRREQLPGWRREALRTSLWLVPTVLVALAIALFALTYALDKAVADGSLSTPAFINTGGADAARAILTAIAAAVITVVGVVFSITIVALTLASTQFGPRMLRTFIRDFGTQVTLGTFVATFVYCILALGSVSSEPGAEFVPHISVSVALALTLVDLGVLIYFINHVAKSIQINEVIHGIARDLDLAIETVAFEARSAPSSVEVRARSLDEVQRRLDADGVAVSAPTSGYLQAVSHKRLIRIAQRSGAVVEIVHRPGHFVVRGRPLAVIWPADAAEDISAALRRAHVIGPSRTLAQDLQFAIDQLVEIAIRALSPAVNDTFTAITCIDWLGDAMCKLVASGLPDGIYRDDEGEIRLIEVALRDDRIINRSFDKIRQAGHDMPAVLIRQLENLAKIAEHATTETQLDVIARQADMVERAGVESVAEPNDVADVVQARRLVAAALGGRAATRVKNA
jgi:uncharacterized membrane protein